MWTKSSNHLPLWQLSPCSGKHHLRPQRAPRPIYHSLHHHQKHMEFHSFGIWMLPPMFCCRQTIHLLFQCHAHLRILHIPELLSEYKDEEEEDEDHHHWFTIIPLKGKRDFKFSYWAQRKSRKSKFNIPFWVALCWHPPANRSHSAKPIKDVVQVKQQFRGSLMENAYGPPNMNYSFPIQLTNLDWKIHLWPSGRPVYIFPVNPGRKHLVIPLHEKTLLHMCKK